MTTPPDPTPNIPRLSRLMEVLQRIPAAEFDMRHWGYKHLPCHVPMGHCGTTACALGHYILQTPECGLRLIMSGTEPTGNMGVRDHTERGASGFDIAAEHFGLSDADSAYMFGAECCPGGLASGTERYKCQTVKNIAARVAKIIDNANKPGDDI